MSFFSLFSFDEPRACSRVQCRLALFRIQEVIAGPFDPFRCDFPYLIRSGIEISVFLFYGRLCRRGSLL